MKDPLYKFKCLCLLLAILSGFAIKAYGSEKDTLYTYTYSDTTLDESVSFNNIDVYLDYSGKWKIEDAIGSDEFEGLDVSKITQSPKYVGYRLKLQNASSRRVFDFLIFCDVIDSLWIYDVDGKDVLNTNILNARIAPFEKIVPVENYVYPVILEEGEAQTFYIKAKYPAQTEYFHFQHISRRPGQNYAAGMFKIYMSQFLYAGFMGLMCLVSLFVAVYFRERMFVYFGVLLLAFIGYFLESHGILSTLLINISRNSLMQIIISIIIIFLSAFTSTYLDLKKLMPRFNLAFLVFVFFVVLFSHFMNLFTHVPYSTIIYIHNIIIIPWIIFTVTPIIFLVRKKHKPAIVLGVSLLILFFGSLCFILGLLGVIPDTSLTINGFQIGTVLFSLVLLYGLFSKITGIQNERILIKAEKDKSDELLFNVLPAEIAEELKVSGRTEAREHEMISVLFTDFKSFTQTAEKLSARDLVNEIHACFKAFDAICEKYKIEKIKTIGDAYMAAGGLHSPPKESAKNTVLAALEMAEFIINRKKAHEAENKPAFEMRAGVHTGPVVAGVVGVKKFQYDVWGDTVNTAARMESAGEVGKVNISQSTYLIIKDIEEFTFDPRGKLEAKGKGRVEMYFVEKRQ